MRRKSGWERECDGEGGRENLRRWCLARPLPRIRDPKTRPIRSSPCPVKRPTPLRRPDEWSSIRSPPTRMTGQKYPGPTPKTPVPLSLPLAGFANQKPLTSRCPARQILPPLSSQATGRVPTVPSHAASYPVPLQPPPCTPPPPPSRPPRANPPPSNHSCFAATQSGALSPTLTPPRTLRDCPPSPGRGKRTRKTGQP